MSGRRRGREEASHPGHTAPPRRRAPFTYAVVVCVRFCTTIFAKKRERERERENYLHRDRNVLLYIAFGVAPTYESDGVVLSCFARSSSYLFLSMWPVL